MTARKPVQLSAQALMRILRAASRWPADQKPSDLRREILKAIADHHSFLALRDQKARLRRIQRHASKLADLLGADEENGGVDWCSQWPKELPPPSKVAKEIQRIVEESGVLQTSPQKIIREIIPGSPLEWLVGIRLPEVFEQFFRRDVTLYQKGDYVRFAMQVITECEIGNVKPSTIIKALTNARSGRSRRLHGGRK